MPADPKDGFVFAATGPRHTTLARRAARTLRSVMPGAAIDCFTDETLHDPVFDQVIPLDQPSRRPKIEALRRSRFDRTIYLDNDILAVAPVGDLFTVLKKFDLIGAHENARNSNAMRYDSERGASFPEMNSGVLGLRRTDGTQEFLQAWHERVNEKGAKRDQPGLRTLLWHTNLRVHVLPMEFNFMDVALLPAMHVGNTAPRLLHLPALKHLENQDPNRPYDPGEVLSKYALAQLDRLLTSDRTLGAEREAAAVWRRHRGTLWSRLSRLSHRLRS